MNPHEQNSSSPLEVIGNLKAAHGKYWRLSWPPALAVFLLVLAVAIKLPNFYTSDFVIYVQPQQIQSALIGTVDKKDEAQKFDALIQELISRPRLLSVIQRFNLYPQFTGISGQDKALLKFRKAYSIDGMQSVIQKNNTENPPTFRVSFSHRDSKLAFEVANELQNLFVQESIINIRSETRGTEEFLNSQLKATQQKLEEIETKRQEYIRKNSGKLPVQRERAVTDQREAQARLLSNTQDINENNGRMKYLEQDLQMTIRDPSTGPGSNASALDFQLDPAASLQQQKQALAVLKTRYSDKHPDVIALEKRIEVYEGKVNRGENVGKGTSSSSLLGNTRESRLIRREMSELQVRNSALATENQGLKTKINDLDKIIQSIPIKEQELIEIERDYETTRQLYDKLSIEREKASLQANLIQSQRGSRFRIIEPPVLPRKPAGPPRLMILGGGILGAIAIFFGIPMAFFYFNSALKFKGDVATMLNLPVIGVIPPLVTPAVKSQNRKIMLTSLTTSMATAFIGIIVIIFSL